MLHSPHPPPCQPPPHRPGPSWPSAPHGFARPVNPGPPRARNPRLSCARPRCRPPISPSDTRRSATALIDAATRTRASAPTPLDTAPRQAGSESQRGWLGKARERHRRPKITRRPHKSLRLPSPPPPPRSTAPALPRDPRRTLLLPAGLPWPPRLRRPTLPPRRSHRGRDRPG
ncbi:hypothetical protein PVAP13_4NG150213 [Panicum virgatum]|uniref:Uncharacterized protein n=1 Tax=Panicum virgatum TaxID=38727 RepID=A0A8T0T426_PANVG|nr:hypothetical protein PVAP13_4NG150213 [Panicum virgatum]